MSCKPRDHPLVAGKTKRVLREDSADRNTNTHCSIDSRTKQHSPHLNKDCRGKRVQPERAQRGERGEDVLSAGGADFRRARRFRLRAPTALDRRPAGEEMGCKRQKLRRWKTKRRGKHHQKLPHSVHSHSSNASGVFSQKATPVGEKRLC